LQNEPRSIRFLSLDEAEAIHQRIVEEFGGPSGLRDRGLLDSALHRPRTGYYADIAEMAAAQFESLLINHPFLDGNKRVAFFATDVFLRLNGWRITVEPDPAYAFLIGLLERGECNFESLLEWLRVSIQRLPA
jgi:death-on-curing protein